MNEPYMVTRSPSHRSACLTDTTSSVSSKKFSTPAYQAIDDICYFSFPFRTREDDDDESDVDFDDDKNIANPPYPSYLWEFSELRARQHFEVERNHAIATWNSGVSAR